MVEQKFIDRIEELRHNTYSRIIELQKNLCPMVKEVYLEYVLYYWYEGYKYNLWEEDTHIYAVKDIPFCYDNELRNTAFIDTLDHLVEQDKVWAFILFIDGVAIKWSDITIIHDIDYTYIKIANYKPNYSTTVKMIVFPIGSKQLRYGEDNDVITGINAGRGFYFNSNGIRIEDTSFATDIAMRLEILDPDMYFKVVNVKTLTEDYFVFPDLPDGYLPTLDNIITFDIDGKFVYNGANTILDDNINAAYNMFKRTRVASNIKWAILMYNTSHTKSKSYLYNRYDSLSKKDVKQFIINTPETSSDWANIVHTLVDPFDFEHDQFKTYEENIHNAALYVTNYDYALFKEAFIKDSPIKSYTYTGKEYKALADNKGYVRFSRHHTDAIADYAMVFVNSKLYNYTIDITYTDNTINIPIFNVTDDDHVEILLFSNCNNTVLDIVIPNEYEEVYIHPSYDLDNVYLMSETCADPVYNVPDNLEGRKQYIVEFTYEKTSEGHYQITLENNYYYGRQLKLVPKNQFRHYEFRQQAGAYKIILPTQFNYCHDADQYMIFINGKKIDRTEYTITIMNKDRPFDQLVLYVSTILDAGDYIDIFYLPLVLKEAYHLDQMTMGGLLSLPEKNGYPKLYPLSKDTVIVFINGRKVNPLEIRDVDMNSMLINVDKYLRDEDNNIIYDGDGNPRISPYYIDSIYNVTVCEYIEGSKNLAAYLDGMYNQGEVETFDPDEIDFTKTASDNWKKMINRIIITHKGGSVIINDAQVIGTILQFMVSSEAVVEDTTLKINDVDFLDDAALKIIYGEIRYLETSDPSYKEQFADLKSILYEIIVDYYLSRQEAHTGEPFIMDFEREAWDSEYEDPLDCKIITLFKEHDKLLDYIPVDTIASDEDVLQGQKYIPLDDQ